MRFSALFLAGTLLGDVTVNALVATPPTELASHQPVERAERDDPSYEELWKRRGGGGGGGRGGGGGGSSGGSRGGSGGGTSSGGRGGTSGGGRGSSSDNSGGRTTTGTGPRPAYGGGAYYGGGSTVPYKSGGRSPKGMVPLFAGVAFLAVFPGLWLSGAYLYNYHNPYRFYNQTSEQDESKAVTCACEPELPCACEENEDNKHIDELVGNGSYSALNHSLITVANIDGTETIVINGTLPSGTTAAGGTDEPGSGDGGSGDTNAGNGGLRALLQHAGWWPAAAAVAAIVLTA